MKAKLVLLTFGLIVLSMGAWAKVKDSDVIKGNSLTDLGNYVIKKSEKAMEVDGVAAKTYDLVYDNASNPVKIGVINEKKCKIFLVRTADFEVQYTCNKEVFGARPMEKKFRNLPEATSNEMMDRVNLFSQRVICQQQRSEEELLGLIACYFPNLVDKQYHEKL